MNQLNKIPDNVLMAPGRWSLIYLSMTFVLFLVGNTSSEVETWWPLVLFVTSAFGSLFYGFKLGIYSKSGRVYPESGREFGKSFADKLLLALGILYLIVWGVNQVNEYGAQSISDVAYKIFSPGEAYKDKFDIYQMQLDTGLVSRITQMLIIASFVYAPFVPLVVLSWHRMGRGWKFFFVLSISIYALSFLFIGTLKGIGDILIFLGCGTAILLGRNALNLNKAKLRKFIVYALILVSAFSTYMVANQTSRASEFNIQNSIIVGDLTDSVLAKVVGHDVAFGVYATLGYPSHGYLGLSKNLEQPFVFSHGAGLVPAFESYRMQYLGGEDYRYLTYPFRTEAATGWPAGMYWATIFPWLASDISFFGVPVLMFLTGFVFARVWIVVLTKKSYLAVAAMGQLMIFVAFIPANNQILMSRQGLWIAASLIVIWGFKKLIRGAQS